MSEIDAVPPSNKRHSHLHESYLVNQWNDGTTCLLTFICTEKNPNNIISHQIMQSSIALQIKTQYKTNSIYCTINMEPQKINQSISILQKINS